MQAVTYGSGTVKGKQYYDTVTLGPLNVTGQGIGVANRSSTIHLPKGVDGILGYVTSRPQAATASR